MIWLLVIGILLLAGLLIEGLYTHFSRQRAAKKLHTEVNERIRARTDI